MSDAEEFLSGEVVVEKKANGANIGISQGDDGKLRVQNRGGWVAQGTAGRFSALWPWLATRKTMLAGRFGRDLIVFGEWWFAWSFGHMWE